MSTSFQSTHHPGKTPWGIVYTRFLARPLAVCTIPVMIGATTSALLGQAVWGYLVWGLPAAVLLSSVWTHFSMDRTLAEVHLRAGQAALRSVYDVLRDRALDWKPIFNVRTTSWHIELSIGRTTYELRNTDWPAFDRLGGVARRAFHPEGSTSPE